MVSMFGCSSDFKDVEDKKDKKDTASESVKEKEDPTIPEDDKAVEEPTEPDYSDLVTTVCEESFTYSFGSYTDTETGIFSVPEINLSSSSVAEINDDIYNYCTNIINSVETEINENGQPMTSTGIGYSWGIYDGALSLLIYNYASPMATPYTQYVVYSIDIETETVMTDEEVISRSGVKDSEYFNNVTTALGNRFISYYSDNGVYESMKNIEFFDEQFEKTVARTNVEEATPYFGENGDLYVLAGIYTMAGSGFVRDTVNITNIEIEDNYKDYTGYDM